MNYNRVNREKGLRWIDCMREFWVLYRHLWGATSLQEGYINITYIMAQTVMCTWTHKNNNYMDM